MDLSGLVLAGPIQPASGCGPLWMCWSHPLVGCTHLDWFLLDLMAYHMTGVWGPYAWIRSSWWTGPGQIKIVLLWHHECLKLFLEQWCDINQKSIWCHADHDIIFHISHQNVYQHQWCHDRSGTSMSSWLSGTGTRSNLKICMMSYDGNNITMSHQFR